jgi:hypothetical protein
MDLDRLSVGTVLLAATSVAATARTEDLHSLVRRQIAERAVRDHYDVAAAPAVATVGTALRHELLPPKAETAITAPAGLDVDLGAIVEHGSVRSLDG